MKKIINESLLAGDLNNLVSNHIGIDEYVSKIDESAIVIAFYVKEEDPALDLSRFLEFGPVKNILDTEVSPAPDADGNYLVFVELDVKDAGELARSIVDILFIVEYLTEISEWTYSYKGREGIIVLNK